MLDLHVSEIGGKWRVSRSLCLALDLRSLTMRRVGFIDLRTSRGGRVSQPHVATNVAPNISPSITVGPAWNPLLSPLTEPRIQVGQIEGGAVC